MIYVHAGVGEVGSAASRPRWAWAVSSIARPGELQSDGNKEGQNSTQNNALQDEVDLLGGKENNCVKNGRGTSGSCSSASGKA